MPKIHLNPDEVLPQGIVTLGDPEPVTTGIVIIRGMLESDHADVKAALEGVTGTTPDEYIDAAVATGRFTRAMYGEYSAIEYVRDFRAPEPTEPEPEPELTTEPTSARKRKSGNSNE